MKLVKWGRVGLPLLGVAGLAATVVVAACSSDTKKGGTTPTPAAGQCQVPAAGEYPVANCAVAANTSCKASPDPGCTIAPKCGDPSTCLPMAKNTGTTLDFRLRRMNVQAPSALATAFVQSAIVTKNIDLSAKECGDNGNGAFNWLARVDTSALKLTTGGAPPSADPFGIGYCFYNHFLADGKTNVVPVTTGITKNADGSYTADAAPLLNVPIFLNGDPNNIIILPISDAKFQSFTISSDNNCIGTFNGGALDSTCGDDPATCEKWKTAGSLGGFITLEAADTVDVADLNESMCVLLTSSSKDPVTNRCKRENGKIAYKGDYCSTSKKPGDCQDSYWLAATFAAAAIKIDESGTVEQCKAGFTDAGAPDAGSDSEVATDSAPPVDATAE